MEKNEYYVLAQIRLQRAAELIAEAEELLEHSAYKSANNRAYYSIEKSVLALLAMNSEQPHTHKGCLLLFNQQYIKNARKFYDKVKDYLQL